MNKFFLLFFIGIIQLSLGQNIEYDINIIIDSNFEIEKKQSSNDSIVIQFFRLEQQNLKNQCSYFIDNNGTLVTKIETKGSQEQTNITLIYENNSDKNMPIVKEKNKVINKINYPLDFNKASFKNITDILKGATNIYLIENDYLLGYYVLKKVSLK